MSETTLHLSITPIPVNAVPDETQVLAVAKGIIDQSKDWKKGKLYKKQHTTVQITSAPKGEHDGAGWFARHSSHGKDIGTFDEFWKGLAENKAENEKDFIPELKRAKQIKQISPTQTIWSLYYEFPPPVAPRIFTVLQIITLDDSDPEAKQGIVVSLPIDLSPDEELSKVEKEFAGKSVRGRYVSVERVREVKEGEEKVVLWEMATSSTPGGSIPNFIAQNSIAGSIVMDVPHYIEWMHKTKAASK